MLVSWNVTRACNLLCKHCYRDAGKKDADELNTKEAKGLLDELAGAGFKIIVFSGGEPLLRQDIYELISYAVKLNLRPVLGSNGTLIDLKTSQRLKDAGLRRAGISLDSVEPEIHDNFRKIKGAWQKSVEAMRNCRQIGLEFQMHTTVTRWNFTQVEKLIDFACEMGACAYHIFFLVPTGRGKHLSQVYLLAQEYEGLLRTILQRQKNLPLELRPICAPQFMRIAKEKNIPLRFERGCLAGLSYCCILPNGDVHPCPYLPIEAGNVRKDKFSAIWKSADIFLKLRSLNYAGRCGGCEFSSSCGGCRANAYWQSGDFMQEDKTCVYEPKRENTFI